MRGQAPKPGPRRLGRAGMAVIAILVVLILVLILVLFLVLFLGRNLWHATEVDEAPPEIDRTQQP